MKAEIGEKGALDYSKKALWRLRDYYNGRLVFITLSGRRELKKSNLTLLQSFVQERGDTYIYDGLDLSYDKLEDGAHPTGKGYIQFAGWIFDYLVQNDLIPCD